MAAPAVSQATIITTNNVNQTVTETGSYSFNLSGAASADITIKAEPDTFTGAFNNVDASTAAGAGIILDPVTGPPTVTALAFGALINPASASFGSGGKLASSFPGDPGDWSSTGGTSYLGFYFTDATGKHAGWADIATTANGTKSSFEILSYAYETNVNQTITAGQTVETATATPEPSSLALLAIGGAGLLAYRRRRMANA